MDLLRALGTFVRVVETGSFSAVARETGTSHFAATRLIGQLEDHFGVRLFHRTTRRLNLTGEGQDLLGRARHLLETTQEMEATLGRQRARPPAWSASAWHPPWRRCSFRDCRQYSGAIPG